MDFIHIIVDNLPPPNEREIWWGILAGPIATILASAGALLALWYLSRQVRESARQTKIAAGSYELSKEASIRSTNEAEMQHRWRKAQYLADQFKVFFSDPTISRVITELDYSRREVCLFDDGNKKYRVLIVQDDKYEESAKSDERFSKFFSAGGVHINLTKALRIYHPDAPFTKWEILVRDDFDRFLFHVETFQNLIDATLFEFDEINTYLHYEIELLAGIQSRISPKLAETISRYIEVYRFEGAAKLVETARDRHNKARRLSTGAIQQAGPGPVELSPVTTDSVLAP
jgi:hypothetical protein